MAMVSPLGALPCASWEGGTGGGEAGRGRRTRLDKTMMKSARPDPRGSSVGAVMDEKQEMPSSKEDKRKEKKPKSVRLFRKKSLKSVGSFMNRIIKTLGTFTHFADARDAEDDDGGFGNGTPCTLGASSGMAKEDVQVPRLAKNPPLGRDKLRYRYGDKTPGVLGLKNHGNTCFMNAVVQCLSNTDLLAEYLGLERYKLDLSDTAGDGTATSGETRVANGEVTEHLASLVRALWTLEYTPQLSVDFKVRVLHPCGTKQMLPNR